MHPAESCASYIAEGLIEYLIDKVTEISEKIKQTIIFKIIPMMNPDGVIIGNSRTDIMG